MDVLCCAWHSPLFAHLFKFFLSFFWGEGGGIVLVDLVVSCQIGQVPKKMLLLRPAVKHCFYILQDSTNKSFFYPRVLFLDKHIRLLEIHLVDFVLRLY